MSESTLSDLPELNFTDATIRKMYQLADRGKTSVEFQDIVHDIVKGTMRGQWKNYSGELAALFSWVKKNVDYRRDPHDVEVLQDPIATLNREHGDCDDFCILLCAAFEVLGSPCRFVTVSTRPDGSPSHVYLETYVNDRWTAADASVQWSTFGWAPPSGVVKNKKIWTRTDVGLSGYQETPVEGLGMHRDEMAWEGDYHYNVGPPSDREGGFASDFHVVNPTPWPNNISNTFAPGIPGDEVSAGRLLPASGLAPNANESAEGNAIDPLLRFPQTFPTVASQDPPKDQIVRGLPQVSFDKDVWAGAAPVWHVDPRYMLPGGQMNGMSAYFTANEINGFKERAATRLAEYLTAHGAGGAFVSGLGGLGSLATDASNLVKGVYDAVLGTGTATTADIINAGIDVGADAYAKKLADEAKKAAASGVTTGPVKPPVSSGLPSWAIPAAAILGVIGVGYFMSRR